MTYYLSVFPGLGEVAVEEAREQAQATAVDRYRLRNAEVLRVTSRDGGGLMGLRTVEDVFIELAVLKLSGAAADLKKLTASEAWRGALGRALVELGHVRGRALPARVRFRVVAQAEDARWRAYRRVDLQAAAEAGVLRARPGWRLAPETAPVEIWLHQAGRELLVSLRLTAGEHRSRGGREVERAAALRPTIAAAMVRLSEPQPDDVFLDPMCGSGTILLERAVAGPYQLLVGGDIDPAAVRATLANFGPRHQPRRIEHLDARALPLDNASVTALVTNLPWGRQVGEAAALPDLYTAVLREAGRVLAPGGRLVLLASEWQLLKRCLGQIRDFEPTRTVQNVEVLGRRADILALRKR